MARSSATVWRSRLRLGLLHGLAALGAAHRLHRKSLEGLYTSETDTQERMKIKLAQIVYEE
jgi:hypothetical protein